MHKILTVEERKSLIKQHRHECDGKVRDRIKAVLAYDDGYSVHPQHQTQLTYGWILKGGT